MAKKSVKKVKVRKGSKSAATTKSSQLAKKTVAKKQARTGGSHVDFGVHGMATIMKNIQQAGLESEFNNTLEHDDKFVRVRRKSLTNIKEFVESKPELADLAR